MNDTAFCCWFLFLALLHPQFFSRESQKVYCFMSSVLGIWDMQDSFLRGDKKNLDIPPIL